MNKNNENKFWLSVRKDADLATAYLKLFPNGSYTKQAHDIIQKHSNKSKARIGEVESINTNWGFVVIHSNKVNQLSTGQKLSIRSTDGKLQTLIIKKIVGSKISAVSEDGNLSFKVTEPVFKG